MTIKNEVQFFVIGAQKSGTTTLFHLLNQSPFVYIPESKEAPFMLDEEMYAEGKHHCVDHYFSSALSFQVRGTVTPHYLNDPRAAHRIKSWFPDAKLVVILRDPVERTYSHYRMSVRRGIEDRAFDEAMAQCLEDDKLEEARAHITGLSGESLCYVAWSEYGRLLERYLEIFSPEQMHVIALSSLRSDAVGTVADLCRFLEISSYELDRPNIAYNVGQTGKSPMLALYQSARRIGALKVLWRKLPLSMRDRFLFGMISGGSKEVGDNSLGMKNFCSKEILEGLVSHFERDSQSVESMFSMPNGWRIYKAKKAEFKGENVS